MGTGTDVAMTSAQLTLVKGDLRGIATAIALSHATVANMMALERLCASEQIARAHAPSIACVTLRRRSVDTN